MAGTVSLGAGRKRWGVPTLLLLSVALSQVLSHSLAGDVRRHLDYRKRGSPYLVTVNKDTFEERVVEFSGVACVQFFHPTDTGCHEYAPKYEELAQRMKQQIRFATLNILECPDLTEKYEVLSQGVPPVVMCFTSRLGDPLPLKNLQHHDPADVVAFLEEKLTGLPRNFANDSGGQYMKTMR